MGRAIEQEIAFGHGLCWLPVCLGIGAATWFSLPFDPPVFMLLAAILASAVLWFMAGPGRMVLRLALLATGLVAAGASLAAWETWRRDTIILDTAVTTTITARVISREADHRGRFRYQLEILATERPVLKRPPVRVKVTAGGSASPLALGAIIAGRVRLMPPSGPALPGLNDFGFDAYFEGNGAFGYFYGTPKALVRSDLPGQSPSVLAAAINGVTALRIAIGDHIRSRLPGDSGAFASSMVTDDRRAIGPDTAEALRLAGLAHIVAISGLNMALAAGIFFVGFRSVLSLSQRIAHKVDIKKIAAFGALVTVSLYYLISGFAVSAERAYVMMVFVLLAVLLGRPAISLRNVALSAIIILVLSPSAVMGPGFQMSFAATLALVSGYRLWQDRPGADKARASSILTSGRLTGPIWRWATGIVMTSLIGGLSTALYSIEHFHRIALGGLPANLLAMPIVSFIVMPAGLLALVLMPFGLDGPALWLMGFGLDQVIAIATHVADLKGEILVGRIPDWLFAGISASLVVLALAKTWLRYLGMAGASIFLLAHLAIGSGPSPDLVIHEDATLVALPLPGGLAVTTGDADNFILRQWLGALALEELVPPVALPDHDMPRRPKRGQRYSTDDLQKLKTLLVADFDRRSDQRFACRKQAWCMIGRTPGRSVLMVRDGALVGQACDLADWVITPARTRTISCRSGAHLITAQQLRHTGSIELRFLSPRDKTHFTITEAAASRARPWMQHRAYDWRSGTFREI